MPLWDPDHNACKSQIYDPRVRPWMKNFMFDHLDDNLNIIIDKA